MVTIRCPRPSHAGSHVVRAGRYATADHRRQLFLCRPRSGTAHRFAGPLAREVLKHGTTCVECLTELDIHEGPPYPRRYQFPARQIAEALVEVGRGTSYRAAAEISRIKAGRQRRNALAPVYGANGQVVGDWAEAFAPVIWERVGPSEWPAVIAVDELPVNGSRKLGNRLYSILGAQGYPSRDVSRPWLFDAVPNATIPAMAAFLRSLDGAPEVVVCDQSQTWIQAIRRAWPTNTPEIVLSEFHIGRQLDFVLRSVALPDGDPFWDLRSRAFYDAASWTAFEAAARLVADRRLEAWLDRMGPTVLRQLNLHATRHLPRSTGGIEGSLKEVGRRIGDRFSLYTNRERLSRALRLVTLDMRKQSDGRAWARHVAAWLADGRRTPAQRAIADPLGASSLRRP